MTQHLVDYGLVLLFVLIAMESAGVPLPGETALIAAAIMTRPERGGHWSLWLVIVVAATAAIVGDNIGYWLGRVGGRKLISRWGFADRYAAKALPPAERFFKKHGAKTVFFGRFIALLRVTSAWLAGISKMHWWLFFLWNALGGIVWAAGVSFLAYWAGKAAADAVSHYGLYAVVAIIILLGAGYVLVRIYRKRLVEDA